MIDIIDYRAGNAPSVLYALQKLKIPARLISKPEEISRSERIVLPGVGAAAATIDSLRETGCLDSLEQRVMLDGVPFLGICVGLQILFEYSEEHDTQCLGWLRGCVRRFSGPSLKVPQIGWNEVCFRRQHHFTHQLPANSYYYFVNSFYVDPSDADVVYGTTDYGIPFCSFVIWRNIVAAQFHLEKSGPAGLRILKTFATIETTALC